MNKSLEPQRLNIFDYKNGIQFLNDHYKSQKCLDPQFNYDHWSYSLGFKSRSFMYLICSRKRKLSSDSSQKIAKYFKFTDKEYEHFILITDHDKMDLPKMKEVFQDRSLETLSIEEKRRTEDSHASFLKSQTMPLIIVLLSFPDFVGTKENILKRLNMDEKQLDQDLIELMNLELIEQTSDSTYKAVTKNHKFPDGRNETAIKKYHENSLNEALVVNQKQILEKSMRSLLFAMSGSDFKNAAEEIENFARKIKNKYSSLELKENDLYRLNVQMYKIEKN